MEASAHFKVRREPFDYGPALSARDFETFQDWLSALGISVPASKLCLSFQLKADDTRVSAVIENLAECGWTAYHGYPPPELRSTHYQFEIKRTWDEADLDTAPLLRLMGFFDQANFSLTYPVDPLGNPRLLKSDKIDSPVKGGAQGWDEPFGYFDGARWRGVHPLVKQLLERELIGGSYPEVEWDEPSRAKGKYHFFESNILMPPCLTPVVAMDDMLAYEESCYTPPELAFSREAVEALGPFDIAWTQEITGEMAPARINYRSRSLIVSQQFRRLAKSLMTRPTQVLELYPVKLV